MIIKRITVVLGPSPKEEVSDNPPSERIIEFNRDTKRWFAPDGLHPGEISLAAAMDKVRSTWGGEGTGT